MRTLDAHVQALEQGEQIVHRLRNWEVGDRVYGVSSFKLSNDDSRSSSGKTFTTEENARAHFEKEPIFGPTEEFDTILFAATIQTVTRDPPNPADPGEPPLKYAQFENVEILDRKGPSE
jgi:hypothetical protein